MNNPTRTRGGDRLPPHSPVTERSVLGALLREPGQISPTFERFQTRAEVFFELAHREIWNAMIELHLANQSVDVITVTDKLKTAGKLDQVGGYGFISGLPDQVELPINFTEWQDILWTKFLAREAIKLSRETAYDIWDHDGLDEHLLGEMERRFDRFKMLTEAGAIQPQTLVRPETFQIGFLDQWFQRKKELAGWDLPIELADLRIRPHEFCLFTADNGAGKSTFLGHLAVVLAHQGLKVCIASLEVPCEVTLWILSRQLIGASHPFLDETPENTVLLDQALTWLNERILLYNFLGIGNWHHILDAFRYAQAHLGSQIFILDSALKLGIPDDDYAQQTAAANAFSDFCVQTGAHLTLVVHQNKAEGKDIKRKVRGASTWTDAAHVVISISRNEKKDERMHELVNNLRTARLDNSIKADPAKLAEAEKKFNEGMARCKGEHDSTFILKKQRSAAAQWQNASRHIFFHRPSLQFMIEAGTAPVNYLVAPSPQSDKLDLPTDEEIGRERIYEPEQPTETRSQSVQPTAQGSRSDAGNDTQT